MPASRSIVIVGAGMFGLTAACELCRRGWQVSVVDSGIIPRREAASTDISKVVRIDYGNDELYTAMGEAALAGWHLWNERWGESLYHQDGFLLLSADALQPRGFEDREPGVARAPRAPRRAPRGRRASEALSRVVGGAVSGRLLQPAGGVGRKRQGGRPVGGGRARGRCASCRRGRMRSPARRPRRWREDDRRSRAARRLGADRGGRLDADAATQCARGDVGHGSAGRALPRGEPVRVAGPTISGVGR